MGQIDTLQYVAGAYYFTEEGEDTTTVYTTGTYNATLTGITLRNPPTTGGRIPDRAAEAEVKSKVLFGQVTWTPAAMPDLHVTAGGRYTDDSKDGSLLALRGIDPRLAFDQNNKRFDPTLTVAWDLSETTNIYAKYAQAYRAGGSNTRSATLRAFDEEEVISYEVGLKTELLSPIHRTLNPSALHAGGRTLPVSTNGSGPMGTRRRLPPSPRDTAGSDYQRVSSGSRGKSLPARCESQQIKPETRVTDFSNPSLLGFSRSHGSDSSQLDHKLHTGHHPPATPLCRAVGRGVALIKGEENVIPSFSLAGEVAVITGAGRGIGEGIAKVLAGAGAAVVCAARRKHEIERVSAEIVAAGGRAIGVATDVTQAEALTELADKAFNTFGRLDIWVNNAGGSPVQKPLIELPVAEWDATLALNLSAIFHSVRAAMRHMADGGRIVNVSSIAAEDVFKGSGHYSAAKAGVNMLTRTLAHELGPKVRVNAILPGFVPTEVMMAAMSISHNELPGLLAQLDLPAGRLGTPADLGAAVLYLCSPAASWVTGQCIRIAGTT